jgi:methylthioribulose-1-phosphate dehydratase
MEIESVVKNAAGFSELARLLVDVGRDFYRRGWVMGTSGNFSAVVSRDPLSLAITASGLDKGRLREENILQIDERGDVIAGQGRPSDETLLHLSVARVREAGAVLHTHSVWSTILSEAFGDEGGFAIGGYEMLKGLSGVRTHEHREWLPVIENPQDMAALAQRVEDALTRHKDAHAFLLRRHGLYTWGHDLKEARRHTEILEFLLEVTGQARK